MEREALRRPQGRIGGGLAFLGLLVASGAFAGALGATAMLLTRVLGSSR